MKGFSPHEIGTALGRSPRGIALILSSATVQDEIARRRQHQDSLADDALVSHRALALETIQESAVRAAEALDDQLSNPDPKIVQGAAKSILDIAFGKKDLSLPGQAQQLTVINVQVLKNLNLALSDLDRPGLVQPGPIQSEPEGLTIQPSGQASTVPSASCPSEPPGPLSPGLEREDGSA
jgi:hypothetical protein